MFLNLLVFVDPDHPKKVYKVVKALYGLHQAPRAWYATLSTFLEKHGYRRGTIDKTLFIKKDKKDIMLVQVYVDDIIFGSTRKSWCDEFEALMKGRFQMSSMGELIFFLGLQVKQKTDGIFISQDKYVADMLKKFDLTSVKTAITPMETKMALTKDEEADEVDVTPKTSHLNAVKRIFKLISWQCKKQTIWLPLQQNAEYVAAASAVDNIVKLRMYALKDGAELNLLKSDQSAGPADQAEDQPSSSAPLPSSSHPPVISATLASEPTPVAEPTTHHTSPSPEPDDEQTEHIFEQPSPEHQPLSPRQETEVPQSQDPSHPHVPEARTMTVEDLLHLVPNLITKVDSLETELKQTKLTMGRSNLEEEEISPTILEAAKILSKVASQKSKLVDKGKRYNRRKESKGKDISTGFEDISTGFEEVNTGGLGVSTGSGPVSSARGQREGKAPMIVEETQAPKRTKEQIQQEEASLAEAIRLQTLEEEETAKQVHLDALLAKRMEEEELTEQQKQRKAQVQFEAQHYTEEDWDAIRAKLEANAELTKNVLGKELPEEDFAKKMVELVNQRKKFFAEERAKARRSKPMTQSLLRNYMMNYLKNQGTWKLTQLKKLSFEEVKEEFDKLVKQVESFVPMNIEATKAQLKRYGEELQTEISKKQRIDDKDVSVEEKVTEVKEEEPVIRTGKRKKQKARKGINVDKSPQGDSETDEEESVEAMNPTPLDTKSNIVANWKIFQQGKRSIYQIIRANGADTVYMSFGAMLKDFIREDLIELYRLIMQKYGTNRPEDAYDKVLWSDLRATFDPPLNEDAIWSLPL
ncbi:putative ribonuclease H-like domain-containing protein [Tanacetum coccineum]|uniref:Ribonuclease H-like domain-containing protein n=1 Tax=Tanacetum coccineum TaxID=301880 RepID=A0ABQ5HUK1_9ASTR